MKSNCKDFLLKVKEIAKSVLDNIENLDKDNNINFIKRMFSKNYLNEEMKKRDIYNNQLDKLKKTYKNEMKNENDQCLEIKSETTTGDK